MGLIHPADLQAWHRWQGSRHRLRRLRHAIGPSRPAEPERLVLSTYADEPRVLVALDSGSPTSNASLVEPLAHLDVPLAVLSPGAPPALPGREPVTSYEVGTDLPDTLRGLRAVLSLGHYLPRGAVAHEWSRRLGAQQLVVQHGALTPYAPPLPPEARLLAWSDADARYWADGRPDVSREVVGSQLLWDAASTDAGTDPDLRLTYLGQMHAAELPRSRLVRSGAAFCRDRGAVYRPHPSERDVLSRLAHDGYRRLGITVDASVPLSRLAGPVVSAFSTGVLEAATQGRDAWVDLDRPPAWLGELWDRYGMHRLGDSPTPAPDRPSVEPARRIAEIVRGAAS